MNEKKSVLSFLADNREFQFFTILFAAFILKYLIYGFCYYPALDDYIQYGGYPLYENPSHVFLKIGTISARPLSALFDLFLWGSLWNIPQLFLILSSAFHFFSCVFLYKTAKENDIALSPLFAIFFLFFPLGSEGAYWVSASSRIVCGVFFSALSLFTLTKYLKNRKFLFFILFFLCSACAFALYESCAVFCFVACAFILIKNKNIKQMILPLSALCLLLLSLFAYMKLMQNVGMIGSRATESSFSLIFTQFKDFLTQLMEILTKGSFNVTIRGFSSGLKLILSKGFFGLVYFILILCVCIFLGRFTAGSESKLPSGKRAFFQIASGFILFFSAFAPNLIVSPVWITYRTMFIPLIGLYMIFDIIFFKIKAKSVQTVLLTSLMFIFIVSGINEYDTYKRNAELDDALVKKVCYAIDDDVKCGKREAVVLLDFLPEVPQVSFYKDHVKSVFYSDWSLTGAVREELKNINIKKVTPVFPDMTFDYSDCFVVDLRSKN